METSSPGTRLVYMNQKEEREKGNNGGNQGKRELLKPVPAPISPIYDQQCPRWPSNASAPGDVRETKPPCIGIFTILSYEAGFVLSVNTLSPGCCHR